MGERSTQDGPVLHRPRISGRGLALTGAALLSIAPFFVPNPAQAALNREAAADQGPEDLGDDSISIEPLVSDAIVVQEAEDENLLKIEFNQRPACVGQFGIEAKQWWPNPRHKNRVKNPDGSLKYNQPVAGNPDKPGDSVRAWFKQVFRVTGFISQSRTIVGTSDENVSGEVLFSNTDPAKPPGMWGEWRGVGTERNQMPATIVHEGGITKRFFIPCGTRVLYTFRGRIPAERVN